MTLGSVATPALPLISSRQGISWGLSAPEEDASVLVLTSPGRHYIDIRFALEGPPTSGVFWAFAGTVTYKPLVAPGSGDAGFGSGWVSHGIRGEWRHPIDSLGAFESIDQADLFNLPNGDQVEVGLLENPATGKPDRFTEYWTSKIGESTERELPYAVLIHTVGDTIRGMVIRVGHHAQGIYQLDNDGVMVSRWENVNGSWSRDGRSTDTEGKLPMAAVTKNSEFNLKEGTAKLEFNGKTWVVVESSNSRRNKTY